MEKIEIDEETYKKIISFKKVVETVIGEKIDEKTLVELVISRGLTAMVRDIIPKDLEITLKSIEQMFNANPEFVSEYIYNTLTDHKTKQEKMEEKKKVGKEWANYIG